MLVSQLLWRTVTHRKWQFSNKISLLPKKKSNRKRWKIIQMSSRVMKNEAFRRRELINEYLQKGYAIRVEIYEKAVQEPDIIPGDTLALRDFLIANLNEKCDITNEDIRYTYGLNLIGQMAFDIQLKPELDKKHKQMKCIADENPMTDEINVRQCVSQRITDHSSKFAVIFGDEDYELISDGDYEQTAAYANLFRDPFTVHLQPKWKENKKMNKFIVDDIEEDENNSQTYFDPKHLTTNGRNTR